MEGGLQLMSAFKNILYLSKTKFDFYDTPTGRIISYVFTPPIVEDLEIVKEEDFVASLKAFLETNKIVSAPISVFLADSFIFKKKLEGKEVNEAQNFIDMVPFQEVSSETIPLENETYIVATNQTFLTILKDSFQKLGSTIDLVFPSLIVGNNISSQETINPQIAQFLIQRINSLQPYNMLKEYTSPTNAYAQVQGNGKEKKSKSQLPLLIGVFGILLLVLVVVIVITRAPASPSKKNSSVLPTRSISTPSAAIIISPTLFVSPIISPLPPSLSGLRVSLIRPSKSASIANQVKQFLESKGITLIQENIQEGSSTNTLVIVSSKLSPEIKNVVESELKSFLPNAIVQENSDITTDISITIGSSL